MGKAACSGLTASPHGPPHDTMAAEVGKHWKAPTEPKHPQSLSQVTESLGGHHGGLSPPGQGRAGQAVLLRCRGRGEPSPGRCWGPLGTRQQTQGPEHPRPGLGQEPGPGMTFQPGTAPSQPGTADASGWEGAAGILLGGPSPATHSGHVPSPDVPCPQMLLSPLSSRYLGKRGWGQWECQQGSMSVPCVLPQVGAAAGRGVCRPAARVRPRMGSGGVPVPIPRGPQHSPASLCTPGRVDGLAERRPVAQCLGLLGERW